MDFSESLSVVKKGGKVRRQVWQESPEVAGKFLFLYLSTDTRVMPLLMMAHADGTVLRPFAGANWDLLATDWEAVE